MTKVNPLLGYIPPQVTRETRSTDTPEARKKAAQEKPKPTRLHIQINPDPQGKQD